MHLGGLVMALTKYRVGDLITVVDERNDLGIKDFYGVNIKKEFMPTAANTEGLDESKYKVSAYGFTKNEDELIHKLEYLNFFEDWMIEYVLYSDDHEELYFWGRT